ncbi:MAG: hypothetical protein KUG79_11325 [Pseudomonadales bacterium]|nr:hypothetical protein [Pseudomonadales bacterium]
MNTLLHIAGLASALLYYLLGHPIETLTVGYFLIIAMILFALSVAAFKYLNHQAPDQARYQTAAPSVKLIIGWAIIFRLIGITSMPILEDDFYRYLWDGFLFAQAGSPYGVAPDAFFADESIPSLFQQVLDGINNPDIATIYGPVMQLSFLLAYFLTPGEVFGLQLIYAGIDILLILLLAKLIPNPGNRYALILYAWSPLIVKEFAFTAHPDVVGVLFLMLSFFCLQRQQQKLALVLLGVSICAKIFAILLAPFVLIRCRARYWVYLPLTIAVFYLPFIWQTQADLAGLLVFANDWQFNSSVYALINIWLSSDLSKLVCLLIFGSFYAAYGWHFLQDKKNLMPRGDWIFAIFFLIAPVVNAWYLIWLLAFATIFPSRWAWTASITVLLSYLTGFSLGIETLALYQQPLWAIMLEYGLVGLALCFDLYAHAKKMPIAGHK